MMFKNGLRIWLTIVTVGLSISFASAQNQQLSQADSVDLQSMLSSPRRALHTFIYWQQESHERPGLVAATMKLADAPRSEKLGLARKLLMVLDSRGLIVEFNQVPGNPAYTDSLSGLQQYTPFPRALPKVSLVRTDREWVFSRATIDAIPDIYRSTFSVFVDVVLDNLPAYMKDTWLGIRIWQYFAVFAWLLIGLVLRKLFEYILQNYANRLTQKTRSQWDDRFVKIVEKPAGFTFAMLFYWATYSNLMLSVNVNYYISTFFEVAVSLGIVWLLYNFSDILSDYLTSLTTQTESKLDDQLVPLIRKTLKIFIVVLGILIVLQNQGINVASLLAGLGLGGLAFALAARDTLANFFGSITIFLDKPFQIGDWVKTNSVEGTVEEVGFRSTRIRSFYNSLISVPNAKMADAEVDNLGLREYRRLKTVLNLTYSTTPEQMEAFVEGIKAIIRANKYMRKDFYEVHFNNFGPHSLDVLVYCFLKVPSWSDELQQKHNFFVEILRLAKDIGVEFAFPTQTLHVDSFYGEQPRQVGERHSEEELAGSVYAFGPNGEKSRPEGPKLHHDGHEVDFSVNADTKTRGS